MSEAIRVLHVDDDPAFLDLTRAYLEREADLSVVTADGATAGLSALEERAIDCVVTDYQMPGRDGIAFLRAVREDRPELPVLLFTGEGSETVASEAISAGVTDYLQKGGGATQFEVLANRVRNVVGRYRATREAERLGRLFEALYDNPLIFASVLGPDGRVRSVNETAARITGSSHEVCEGRPFREMSWWSDDEEVREAVDRARAGETVRFQTRFEATDGVRAALAVLIPVGDDVRAILAVGQDLTGAGGYLRDALDAPEEPLFLFDGSGRLREWNDAVTWVTGYEPSTLREMTPPEFVAADDRAAVFAAMDRAVEEGHATVDATVETADGDHLPYEFRLSRLSADDGPAPGFVGIAYDVSERRRRERALKRLHTVTRDLLRAERRSAVASMVAEAVEDVLGYPLTVVRLLDDEDRLEPVVVSRAARLQMGERPIYAVGEGAAGVAYAHDETTVYDDIRRLDDGYDRGEVRSVVVVPVEGHGVVVVADTDRGSFGEDEVRLVETLAANAAVALDRLGERRRRRAEAERLQEFASVLSHDLRTPLTTASGWLADARREYDDERLRKAADALDRMSDIVDDVLALSRTETAVDAVEPVSLAVLARDCWASVDRDDASLRVESARSVLADEGLLGRLVENLLRNAVEHGSTDDEARAADDPAVTVTVGDLPDGFYVADDGPGVRPAERDRVFERGYAPAGGTGLGLRIVERVVDVHGWSVRVTESESGGARFEVSGVERRS
jgi:PAS domain S-box-containing protein